MTCSWKGERIGEMRFQSKGKMGKDCPTFLQSLFEKFDKRSFDDGGRELIPIFHNPHGKG